MLGEPGGICLALGLRAFVLRGRARMVVHPCRQRSGDLMRVGRAKALIELS
jgi:hypothetical protein